MKFFKIVLFIISSCMFLQCFSRVDEQRVYGSEITDSERFALEFPLVGIDNIFVFRNASETADILANGRGIVFMGFKECPWCQPFAVFLHEVAVEMGIEQIYYLDIREDRQNNTESYQRILNILTGRLRYDDEGRPRVFVPDLSIVSRGRIILRDFGASEDAFRYNSPEEYWTEERVYALKVRLRAGICILNQITRRACAVC